MDDSDDSDENDSNLLYWFGVFTGSTIMMVNLPILGIIWKEVSLTLINQLIGLDCILCLGIIPIVLNHSGVFQLPCSFITTYAFFTSLLNRLLPLRVCLSQLLGSNSHPTKNIPSLLIHGNPSVDYATYTRILDLQRKVCLLSDLHWTRGKVL